MRARTFLAAIVVALVSLGANCTRPTPPGGTDCVAACTHLGPRGLNCPAFGPTPGAMGSDGVAHPVPCETWLCQSHGVKSACLVKSETCDEAGQYQEHGCP